MSDAVTPNYGWTLPTVGGDENEWGGFLNSDISSIDATVYAIQESITAYSSNRTIYTQGSNFVGSITGNQLTITAVNTGLPAVGQTLYGANVAGGTTITAAESVDSIGRGTWTVSQTHTVPVEAIASANSSQFAPGIAQTLTLVVSYLSAPGTLIFFDGEMQLDLTISGSSLPIPNGVPIGVQNVTVVGPISGNGSTVITPSSFTVSMAAWFASLPTTPGSTGTFWNNGGTLAQA
jgi:hypothetical protein